VFSVLGPGLPGASATLAAAPSPPGTTSEQSVADRDGTVTAPADRPNGLDVRILLWNIHGGYTDSLLHGEHQYLYLPADASGSGGPPTPPASARGEVCEVTAEQLRDEPPDVVLLQRPEDLAVCTDELGLRPGRDVGAVFCEHNIPRAEVPDSRHPLADRDDLTVVHVTHLNDLLWDCGSTATSVVEHGIADPGLRFTGDLAHLAFVVNEPVRRWRNTGTDLLRHFGAHPVDAFGIDADLLPAALPECQQLSYAGNLKPEELYAELCRRRVYLHLNRWTSLGLSLIQSMMLGLPVVVLNTTEASSAVPPEAGALSNDVAALQAEAAILLADRDEAARRGEIGRAAALSRFGIERFVGDWDAVFEHAALR